MTETINVQAGDAIRVASPWDWAAGFGRWSVNVGDVGIIGGMIGEPLTGASVTFHYSVYRDDRAVSCSGGPATIHTCVCELRPTADRFDVQVWKFQNGLRQAYNSEWRTVNVAVWDWTPGKGNRECREPYCPHSLTPAE